MGIDAPERPQPQPYDYRRWKARVCNCGKIEGRPVLGCTRGILRREMVPDITRIKPFLD
jgi:hypothetical protein